MKGLAPESPLIIRGCKILPQSQLTSAVERVGLSHYKTRGNNIMLLLGRRQGRRGEEKLSQNISKTSSALSG